MIALLNTSVSYAQVQTAALDKLKLEERVKNNLKENGQTIRFLENKGQIANSEVLYYFEGLKGSVYIERGRIRFVVNDDTLITKPVASDMPFPEYRTERIQSIKGTHTFSLYLNGSNQTPNLKLGDSFSTNFNYMLGEDPKGWVSGVKAAKELTLEDIYSGIDLRLYSTSEGKMEFDWVLEPGADYRKVNLKFEGQDQLVVEKDGSLKVGLHFTDVKFHIPESYQVTEQGKVPVSFAFKKFNNNIVNFTTQAKIDPRLPLVIDPTLNWGTFMDGNQAAFDQYLFAIQVDDADGMVYCAGATNINIPTGSAPYTANGYLNTVTGLTGTGATPRVAVVYRMTGTGTSLVDLTLYGPSTVTGSENTVAYALSLSSTRVFIGGHTTADIPTAGSPFDGTRNGNDGFVAVFSKDLGTLVYATYMGGTGADFPGVTSVRALSDVSFVAGLTVQTAALPAAYITAGVADATFGGASEMYIGKFITNLSTISWGTYVGGSSNETFNDLEVFGDGRVAFCGSGTGTITEVNGAAASDVSTTVTDGIIGVLNSTATAFNYLDKIGGTGADLINDVELVGEKLYWTGTVATGFPTSAGTYDTSHNGSSDAVVGSVNAAGSTGYIATFYGTTSADIGSGLRLVTQTQCNGTQTTFLLVFGSTSGSVPSQNIGTDPFFDSSNNGGIDIFFAGFKGDLTGPLQFGTNMGGSFNDYLGDTGTPRGANHLWVSGDDVYVGTTTHSATHSPVLVAGGFDVTKTNGEGTTPDSHIIFSIKFNSILETDYSDAPATYGAPSHTLDCINLRIGLLLDADAAAVPTVLANGDDLAGIDDEDGIAIMPAFPNGGPQVISVTVDNLLNTTGTSANLYGWIDLNSDGQFQAGEFTSASLANGFTGSQVLTWSGVTVSGAAANHYLRIRLTDDALADAGGTPTVDERSTVAATDGEVEDYRAIGLTCPTPAVAASCQTQAAVQTAYNAWIATASAGGGCNNGTLTNDAPANAPAACGGTVNVTFTYTSACAPLTSTCMSSFTVTADNTPPNITCPNNVTVQCASQIPASNTGSVSASDNCAGSATISFVGDVMGNQSCANRFTVTRTYRATDGCGNSATCSQTITVFDNTAPPINCPGNVTVQCANLVPTPNGPATGASDNCGGTSTVTFVGDAISNQTCANRYTVTRTYRAMDDCGNSATCNQIITVFDNTAPPINCPGNVTVQCANLVPTPNGPATGASDNCGGTSTVSFVADVISNQTCANRYVVNRTYRAMDECGNSATCIQTITVFDNTSPPINCPNDVTVQCANQVPTPDLPRAGDTDNCGGTSTVSFVADAISNQTCANRYTVTRTYRAMDECGNSATCYQTITVFDNTSPPINCPTDVTVQCASQVPTPNGPATGATDNCGGTSTVTFVGDAISNQTCANRYTVTRTYRAMDECGNSATCNQTITVFDNTGPSITCPSDVTVQCAALVPESNTANVMTTDNCGGTATVAFVGDAVSNQTCANRFTVTRTYRATDVCGNSSTCSQTITVFDNTPPMCNTQNITISIDQQIGHTNVTAEQIDNGSSDNCGPVTLSLNPTSFTCDNVGTNTVTLTVTDACSNTSTCTATVTVLACYNPCITINTCLYLQGAAVNANGSDIYTLPMRTTLNNLRVLPGQTYLDPFFGTPHYTPFGQPYCTPPWNYCGTEGTLFNSFGIPGNAGYPATTVDWVLVSVRADAAGTGGPLCQAAALLHSDGHIEFVQPFDCCNLNLNQSYYLVIEHRNHMIVMSNQPVPIVPNIVISTMTYSFCDHQSYIDPIFTGFEFLFLQEKEILPGIFAMYTGNGDQTSSGNADVDIAVGDLNTWVGQNGTFGAYRTGDYNLNGDTNLNDRTAWERNNGRSTTVPR